MEIERFRVFSDKNNHFILNQHMPELPIFYTPDLRLPEYTLNEEESRHAAKVLRLHEGDHIQLHDGQGNGYKAEILIAHSKHCEVKILAPVPPVSKHGYYLHIGIAPTKNIDRFEWFLEKATEIGIDEVTPLCCEHSERKSVHPERLQKVMVSAMKQSQKLFLPVLRPVTSFDDFMQESIPGVLGIAHCEPGIKQSIPELFKRNTSITILIGPEGDFSLEEIHLALLKGYHPITLGNSRLRTETAGVVACHSVSILSEILD